MKIATVYRTTVEGVHVRLPDDASEKDAMIAAVNGDGGAWWFVPRTKPLKVEWRDDK